MGDLEEIRLPNAVPVSLATVASGQDRVPRCWHGRTGAGIETMAKKYRVQLEAEQRVKLVELLRWFVEEGLDSALQPRPQVKWRRKRLDRKGEALLVALARSQPPPGRERWTLQMLADRLVEQKIVGSRVMPVTGPCIGD